ncbi:MAG: hypothetical protein Q8Q25_00580 [bacterium]|nr:hypothetical protein [bacterium]
MFIKYPSVNCLLLSSLCAGMLVSTTHAFNTDKKNLGFFGTFGVATVGLSCASNRIAKTNFVNKLTHYTNTDAKDLADCATLSTLCWGSSYLPRNRNIKYFLRFTALITPIIQILATSKRSNRWLSKIPLINRLLCCSNPECEGICNQCKFTALYKKLPFELLFKPSVSPSTISPLLLIERLDTFITEPVVTESAATTSGDDDEPLSPGEERRRRAREILQERQQRNRELLAQMEREAENQEQDLSPEEIRQKQAELDNQIAQTNMRRRYLSPNAQKVFDSCLAEEACPMCKEEVPTKWPMCANGHGFCPKCVDDYARNVPSYHGCPTCRKPLLPNLLESSHREIPLHELHGSDLLSDADIETTLLMARIATSRRI